MNNKNNNQHMVDILFVLTLFFVFALSALTLVILGANVYKTTVDHMGQNSSDRTTYAYIAQKLRQCDDNEHIVTVGNFGDSDAFIITSEVNDTLYNTYLYKYDNHLYELLSRSDLDMEPSDGSAIMELNRFDIDQIDNTLYKLTLSDSNNEDMTIYLSSHSASEGGIHE